MIYSIIRLLNDGETEAFMVSGEQLNSEMQCYTFEGVMVHSNLMVFEMADHEASGHQGKNYNFQASIFNDDELLKLIREQHGKYDLIEVYDQMILKHNVPVCLLTHILYECKVTMGLFS